MIARILESKQNLRSMKPKNVHYGNFEKLDELVLTSIESCKIWKFNDNYKGLLRCSQKNMTKI